MPEFKAWPKIPRYSNLGVIITEKIDGTNGCIIVEEFNGWPVISGVQSRNRFIDINNDNMGFSNWVSANGWLSDFLGLGYHYGEWAGPGIQGNPMKLAQKTFFLFNTHRWENLDSPSPQLDVVPFLYGGVYDDEVVQIVLKDLKDSRSYQPEGIVLYFPAMRANMKYTFDHQGGKWRSNAIASESA